jgi:DNA-binding GntR family transcriptional regulator
MKSGPFSQFRHGPGLPFEEERIDKQSPVPAYAQLAQILRRRISSGTYSPGSRLPSEAEIGKSFKISGLTVRQAVKALADEGLLERIQGSGTFVKRLDMATSHFDLNTLRNILADRENLEVRILKATVEKASGKPQEALGLPLHDPMIVVERLIFHRHEPFILQVGYALFNSESPIVENMLDTEVLTGMLLYSGCSSFKKGELWLVPYSLNESEAELLNLRAGDNAFRLEHAYYDFGDHPAAVGWFLVSPEKMPMMARVGVWND